MVRKAPRRTAERIAEVSLALFNRYGEPNVSTTLISSELNISPGNLYYHFASKDVLVNHLYDRFESRMLPLLEAASDVKDIEDSWFFMHSLFEQVWSCRFLYRDLNNLLARNLHLERRLGWLLERKVQAFRLMLQSLAARGVLHLDTGSNETLSTSMNVLLSYWLSYEYVRDPRHALEPEHGSAALERGARHVLLLLLPHLTSPQDRLHLLRLTGAYSGGMQHTA
ncbi:MAG: TetR/AcrR family transcriptional regulator [Limnohabitans sp.]